MNFAKELASVLAETDFDPAAIAAALSRARVLFFIGNGGSAAIASHMANDFSKNGGKSALSFNDGASLTCLANDFGYDQVFAHPLGKHLLSTDVLVAISSSGESKNILAGVNVARHKGANVITLTGFEETNSLRRLGKKNVYVPSKDYGIVETIHLGVLHAALREMPNACR